MRIAFLSVSSELGGSETSLFLLVRSLRQLEPDWDLTVLVPRDGPLSRRLREAGATVRILPLPAALARLGELPVGEAQRSHVEVPRSWPRPDRSQDIGARLRRRSPRIRRTGRAHQRLQAPHSRRLGGAGGRAGRVARSRICEPASSHAQAPEALRGPRRGSRRQLAQRGGGPERACLAMTRRSRPSTTRSILHEFSPDGATRRSRSAGGPAPRRDRARFASACWRRSGGGRATRRFCARCSG